MQRPVLSKPSGLSQAFAKLMAGFGLLSVILAALGWLAFTELGAMQYDELEMAEGEPPTWRQSILFSNGWEVTLHFGDVRLEEAEALLPVPRNGTARSGQAVPQPV